jgi:hypothetical protein
VTCDKLPQTRKHLALVIVELLLEAEGAFNNFQLIEALLVKGFSILRLFNDNDRVQ